VEIIYFHKCEKDCALRTAAGSVSQPLDRKVVSATLFIEQFNERIAKTL